MTIDLDTLKVANDSGFPLQIALQHLISETTVVHGWRTRYVEHAWINPLDGQSGFIDVVLQDRHCSTFMTIECKRMRESTWVFLHSNGSAMERQHAKSWVTHHINDQVKFFGWDNVQVDPLTPEAIFCAVRGQTANDKRTLIERIGGELISATEALAKEDLDFRLPNQHIARFYFNVIVTTAELKIAKFSPKNISLEDGTLSIADIQDVPYLRFRKQMSLRETPLTIEDYANDNIGNTIAYERENTIFVVRANALADFLQNFEVSEDTVRQIKARR
jgi:hypothetical protein